MNLIARAVAQPVTVVVGVLLVLLAGIVSLRRIPIQLTPTVEDTIVAVTTTWEGASPAEVEQEIVDPQEERLLGLSGLRTLTSVSQQGVAKLRLEFEVGTPKEVALREVSDKLRQVPDYPEAVDEPVVEASDPDTRDYIAWIVLKGGGARDPGFDVRLIQDFAEDRIKPQLERVTGVSEVGVLGGREREVQIRYDPVALARFGIRPSAFAGALRRENRDVAAGALEVSKRDVRVRLTGQYETARDIEDTVLAETPAGPVFVRDVAEVVQTHKELLSFVRSRGEEVIAINLQKEIGANVMSVMTDARAVIDQLGQEGGLLDVESRRLGLEDPLELKLVYDQTMYIKDALDLVTNNIWIGSVLAMAVLLFFLRSPRSLAIIGLAIPISVIGAVVVMVALGRSINVISLAGMAFAVGMVIDNAIVVLENVYRHIEMGKPPLRAALDGSREVFGAVLAATLTTVVVFIPVLLIKEEAGQLFRDISLAIVASVGLSLLVSVTVIPAAAARVLKLGAGKGLEGGHRSWLADRIAGLVHRLNGTRLVRLGIVALFATAAVVGTILLMPPTDYLPTGNRNLAFGLLIPPPGYNTDQQNSMADRIEETLRPFWEAGRPDADPLLAEELPAVPVTDPTSAISEVVPSPLENYFLVNFDGILFHGGIALDPARAVDMLPLFDWAARPERVPGVLAFAFQVPLFQLGGVTGSAIKINFSGDDLKQVSDSALAVFMQLMGRYGPGQTQPDPANFNVPTPELRFEPDRRAAAEAGLSLDDLAFAVQSLGDGALVGDFRMGGEAIDLKVISRQALEPGGLDRIATTPIATAEGVSVPLSSLARPVNVNAAEQINRVSRRRAVTLQFTPPSGLALEQAVAEIGALLEEQRQLGGIPPSVETSFTGSASKLSAVRSALLGDGTLVGTLGSSMMLALLVVYLVMCVLFQSFQHPLVIMLSVPLATLGGFAALSGVHQWSLADRYMPVQQLDVLTMLGFVILIGIVVNNAILIVHQALNFMRGDPESGEAPLPPREAITESVRSRVRPILMSTLTSLGGMSPLVFMPGSGSELYRGLGGVVLGGLLVSTVFTLVLVPLLFGMSLDLRAWFAARIGRRARLRAASASTAVLLALVCLGTLVGCGSTRSEQGAGNAAHARGYAAELVRSVPPGEVPLFEDGPAPREPDTRPGLAVELADRLDELEALGGQAAWGAEPPSAGPDLLGEPQRDDPIGLQESVAAALRQNLGLRVAGLARDASLEGATIADAAFDTVLFADLELERVDRPVPLPVLNGVVLGTPETSSDRATAQVGVRRLLESGATVGASTYFERYEDTTSGFSFVPNPAWRSTLRLEAAQPLLAGRGSEFATADRVLAEREAERSQRDLEADALSLAAIVEQSYWRLVEARALLQIQQHLTAEGAAVEGVLRERRAYDADPAQYADALATLERRRTNELRARDLVRRASDELKALMDDGEHPLTDEGWLVPADGLGEWTVANPPEERRPEWMREPIELRAAVADALALRPELQAALLDIEDADLRVALAANLVRPRLDLVARLELRGEDDDLGSSLDSLVDDEFLGGLLALQYEIPIGNRAARAEERRAQIEGRLSVARYEALVRDVVLEVKTALRELAISAELIEATRDLRLAESENLRALLVEEERRTSLTPEFLALKFQRQEDLARAQLDEIEALARHLRARAALGRATGRGPAWRLEP